MGNLLCASSHSFFPGTLQSVCYVPTEMLRKGILLVLRPLMIDVVDFRAATMKICEISDQKGFGNLRRFVGFAICAPPIIRKKSS